MEYFAGTVTLVERDIVHVQLTRFNGEELGPQVKSVYVLNLPDHSLQVGDFIGANITKYGHIDNRPDTIEQPEGEVPEDPQTDNAPRPPLWRSLL